MDIVLKKLINRSTNTTMKCGVKPYLISHLWFQIYVEREGRLEGEDGNCVDYIRLRDGGEELLTECHSPIPVLPVYWALSRRLSLEFVTNDELKRRGVSLDIKISKYFTHTIKHSAVT